MEVKVGDTVNLRAGTIRNPVKVLRVTRDTAHPTIVTGVTVQNLTGGKPVTVKAQRLEPLA